MLLRIEDSLRRELREAFLFRAGKGDEMNQIAPIAAEDVEARVDEICKTFMGRLPEVHRMLLTDVQAAFDGDPAAQSKEDIIFSYPGFFARVRVPHRARAVQARRAGHPAHHFRDGPFRHRHRHPSGRDH